MLLEFYILRNLSEPAQSQSYTSEQKFNAFLVEAQSYLESRVQSRVFQTQLFRQVMYTFYEEAEGQYDELMSEA